MFAHVIQEHLELKRRNAALEHEMPLGKYLSADPFENHPLFKTEEQARIEDTVDGAESIVDEPTSLDWPTTEDTFIEEPQTVVSSPEPSSADPSPVPGATPDDVPASEPDQPSDENLWSRSRDFDWGD
jgi:hypothetical protein